MTCLFCGHPANFAAETTESLAEIKQCLGELSQENKIIMAAIDDLKAAVARDNASTSAALTAIAAKLSAPNSTDADVEAAATALNAISDKLDAETAALTAAPAPTGGPAAA